MQKFQLELLFQIIGIGSASGLFYKDHSVYVISDNGGYLYEYQIEQKNLGKIPILENTDAENIPKKLKPDFEALASYGDTLFAFGSGSTENRNRMVRIDRNSKAIIETIDLAYLYAAMQSFSNIPAADFNIEGVVYDGQQWFFFQRGNGKKGKNGVFTIGGKNLENDFSVLYNDVKLPKINGVRASFTDAVLVGKQVYFLATAEDSKSTYEDGKIMGSLVGSLDTEKMKVIFTEKITDAIKFEGIALFEKSNDSITFLLCEDNDSEVLNADIYKLVLAL